MKVLTDGRIPVKAWAEFIEDGALAQIANLANLPFAFKHVAIMPDVHQGYGMPIGGVLATQGVVIPNAVGVDIGCGMRAAQTNLRDLTTDDLKATMGIIRRAVPVGFSHHADKQDGLPAGGPGGPVSEREWQKAAFQVGTLGGGNHFIEIQRGSDGMIWLMLHSGSRNIGKQVADHYNKLAVSLNERWHTSVPKDWELAFLPLDSNEGQQYLAEMMCCLEFARANRALMMARIAAALYEVTEAAILDELDIHHNYAAMEHHFGHNVMVHRKGATQARDGQRGIIPGSQGTASYIVKGKGNDQSFMSCSHGAGRKMGRKQAERTLDLAAEIRRLDERGILHAIRGKGDLDEAAGAYKDIGEVMAQQTDLVEPVVELAPLGVVKG